MQLCPSCYEELRQQAVLATPVWKRQVDGIGLFSSQVVVLIIDAKNIILRIGNAYFCIAMFDSHGWLEFCPRLHPQSQGVCLWYHSLNVK